MKRTLYCKNCKIYTDQEHIKGRLCICACGQENYIGGRKRKEQCAVPGLPRLWESVPKPKHPRGRPPVLTSAQIEEAVRLRLAKMKWAGIAARFGCAVLTVQKAVKKYA